MLHVVDHALQTTLGDNLRAARARLSLSQARMADRLGIHRTYLGALERGERNPTLQTVEAIASRLGAEPADLLWDRERIAVVIDADGTARLAPKDADASDDSDAEGPNEA